MQTRACSNPAIGGLLRCGVSRTMKLPQPTQTPPHHDWLKNPPADDRFTPNRITSHPTPWRYNSTSVPAPKAMRTTGHRTGCANSDSPRPSSPLGDIHGAGSRGEPPWRIGIRSSAPSRILGAVELKTARAFHLGDYQPSSPIKIAATITCSTRVRYPRKRHLGHGHRPDGLVADAAATAPVYAGPERGTHRRDLGVDKVMRVARDALCR